MPELIIDLDFSKPRGEGVRSDIICLTGDRVKPLGMRNVYIYKTDKKYSAIVLLFSGEIQFKKKKLFQSAQ